MSGQANQANEEKQRRVVLMGNAFVGKTALIMRKISNNVSQRYDSTIGAAYHSFMQIINDEEYTINVWDTAGQEKYKALGPIYYRNADAALLVYDVTDRSTFEDLTGWIKVFKESAGESVPIILVGNKVDLDDKIIISENEGFAYASEHDMEFVQTSAMTGYNVDYVFQKVAKIVAERPIDQVMSVNKAEINQDKKGCC